MKKILFILASISIILLFSFSKKNLHSTIKSETKWSCAKPTNLHAVRNGTQVTLSWDGPAVPSSYGGYYNCSTCTPQAITFGGSTNTWPITITCQGVPQSIRFSVTSNCSDGTHGYSDPVFIIF